MSRTCKPCYNIFRDVFKENRQECCLLLESGKKYAASVEPCILELKTGIVGNLLLNKHAFASYAEALSRTIAKNFSKITMTPDHMSKKWNGPSLQLKREECNLLIQDTPLFTLLSRHGFCSHLAQAALESYKAHKDKFLFLDFCGLIMECNHQENLGIILEELYAGWKLVFYGEVIDTCKESPDFAKALIAEPQDPMGLWGRYDVMGLTAIDDALHLQDQERETLLQRMEKEISLLYREIAKELAASPCK